MRPLPRALAAAVTVVLVLLSVTVAAQLFHQSALKAAIADTAYSLEVAQQRLKKQQLEYDQALARLPVMQADAQSAAPQAQAAYDQEQALRAQRKALRNENAALKDQIAALETHLDAVHAGTGAVQDALRYLQDALAHLNALRQLSE